MTLKKILSLLMIMSILIPSHNFVYAADLNEIVIHVKPDGDDKGDGTEQNPLASLDGARAYIQKNKKDVPITVLFHAGEYFQKEAVKFTAADSGSEKNPIVYKSAGDGKVTFFGSKKIDLGKFKQVTDEKILRRIPENARGRIGQISLSDAGLTLSDTEFITNSGLLIFPGLYLNNKIQTVARWPNAEFAELTTKVSKTSFNYEGTRPSKWLTAPDAYVYGYIANEYFTQYRKIKSIDTNNKIINLVDGEVNPNNRWCVMNLLEELDVPGEWYIDRKSAVLYYYPSHEINEKTDVLEYAVTKDILIQLTGTKYVTFDGIDISKVYAGGMRGDSVDGIIVRNCRVSNTSGVGIDLYGNNILVENCTTDTTGYAGIRVGRKSTTEEINNIILTNNIVRNNHCYNGGALQGGMCVGIAIGGNGFGTIVENNLVHSTINSGISGNTILSEIKNNELCNLMTETGDAGGTYAGRQWQLYGSKIQYNYIHHLGSTDFTPRNLQDGIFWDDSLSGQTASHNIIVPYNDKRTVGIVSGGGRNNTVEYNIVVGAMNPVMLQDRTNGQKAVDVGAYPSLSTVPYDSSLYVKYFPEIKETVDDIAVSGEFLPKNTNSYGNIYVNCGVESIAQRVAENGKHYDNYSGKDESIFVDAENQDFRIKKSVLAELGMSEESIANLIDEDYDIDEIGMQRDIIEHDNSFYQTYPRNGDTKILTEECDLMWERALFADLYEYKVATDPQMNNVVKSGETHRNGVTITGLEKGKNYYWKVRAKRVSRKYYDEWDSIGEPYAFRTVNYDILDTEELKYQIAQAQQFIKGLPEEGNEIGQLKLGTYEKLKSEIDEATAVSKLTSGSQTKINEAVKKMRDAIKTAKSSYNIGYGKLSDFWEEGFTGYSETEILPGEDDSYIIRSNGKVGGTKAVLNPCEVYTFDAKCSFADNQWIAMGIRQTNYNNGGINWVPAGGNYFIVIKHDVFELQRVNTFTGGQSLFITYPNNGIWKNDEFNHIEFGAVPFGKGVLVVLTVNGEKIFEYLDEGNPMYESGCLTFQPVSGSDFTIKCSSEEKSGEYKVDLSAIASEISYYEIPSNDVSESGSWTQSNVRGYANKVLKVTDKAGSYVEYNLKGNSIGNYKIYYYNKPVENADKNVTADFSTLYIDYHRNIDMSAGEEGWIELGTYEFITAANTAELKLRMNASGTGEFYAPAIKVERVDSNKERLFTNIFAQEAKNAVVLQINNNNAFKETDKYKIDSAPIILNDKTLVPVRFICEMFDFNVTWQEEDRRVSIEKPDTKLEFQIGSNTYYLNGKSYTAEQGATIINNSTMVPLKDISEAIGKKVLWNDKHRIIIIADNISYMENDEIFDIIAEKIIDS
ncbi:MAG: stalk domain-containing protein [Clostridia bacterium]|nr:stalk domain-containing protein [Clostridia bacterium]